MSKSPKRPISKSHARAGAKGGQVAAFDEMPFQNGDASPRRPWAELLALLAAFLAGAACILTFAPYFDTSVSQSWKVVLISAATLCVGFGAAALFYGRLLDRETRALRAGFDSLRIRADALVSRFDAFDRSKR